MRKRPCSSLLSLGQHTRSSSMISHLPHKRLASLWCHLGSWLTTPTWLSFKVGEPATTGGMEGLDGQETHREASPSFELLTLATPLPTE